MFGFRLPENFNYPTFLNQCANFWTRWHISLSNFFPGLRLHSQWAAIVALLAHYLSTC